MDAQVRKLLVIDDCPDFSESLRHLLRGLPVQVRIAGTGAQGLRLAADWLPDVVLCDLRMPAPDGLAVARALRAVPALEASTLIALSGCVTAQDAVAARAAGYHHVWEKLCDLPRLLGLAAQI